MDQGTGETESQDHEEQITTSDEQIPSSSCSTQGKEKIFFWTFLEHSGPVFEPPYKCLPEYIKFKYDGKELPLSEKAEEVAGLYAKKLHRPCVAKPEFNQNFFAEWRAVMEPEEQQIIKDLSKCDFKKIHEYYIGRKTKIKTKKDRKEEIEIKSTYGFCQITNMGKTRMEPIKNYKIEPQDLFCSNGPFMGRLKKRVTPEDLTINCSADSVIPKPPPGHNWNGVIHDNTVSWLGSWKCNITNTNKYIILDSRSKSKQEGDRKKYEIARMLHKYIPKIKEQYSEDWKSKSRLVRQRGVALYLIHKFGFRAGNEKEPEDIDTVGCCSLKIKHIQLNADNKVVFDFEGKASVRYKNEVTVEEFVYKNLSSFLENKHNENDDLFDELNTIMLNDYLREVMTDLTAKVIRTYLASDTFEKRLNEMTHAGSVYKNCNKKEMVNIFKKAVMEVAKLLNHKKTKKKKKSTSFTHDDSTDDTTYNTRSSLCNYIDPRIVITWCERYNIPIEKVYTKAQREQFSWAIAEAGPNFLFCW